MRTKDIAETLIDAGNAILGDYPEIVADIGGETYRIQITDKHVRRVEYYDGIPHKGELTVSGEVVDDIEDKGLPTCSVKIRAEEPRRDNWYNPTAEVWDPVVNGANEIVKDEYEDLGKITRIKVED